MEVSKLSVDADKAREMYERYRSHRQAQTPQDQEIETIYKKISEGKTVIRALASIRDAGLNAEGLPKLAIARADQPRVLLRDTFANNQAVFSHDGSGSWTKRNESRDKIIRVPWDGFILPKSGNYLYEAIVPLIPVHLRPRRALHRYHVLWEAEWNKRYPVDPYLLRRFGADAWVVVAAWDLTDVERAVMAASLNS